MRRGVMACMCGALVALTAAPRTGWSDPESAAAPAPAPIDDDLTTEQWRPPDGHGGLVWNLLALPEYVVRLAFTPMAILVTVAEQYRLDRRIVDLLHVGPVLITPDVKVAGGEGFGLGATVSIGRAAGGELDIGALGRLNGDWEAELELERALAFAEGRVIELLVMAERDQNLRWYGIGNETDEDDRRVLESNVTAATATIDLTAQGVIDVTGLIELGYRHEKLTEGNDPSVPSVDPGGPVMAPSDFGQALDYAGFRALLRYDTRDTEGRPTRGLLAEIDGSLVQELTGAPFSAFSGHGAIAAYLPVLPYHRVVVLDIGVSLSAPFQPGDEIPLHALTTLGRKQHLRGYSSDRFRDRHGWWASAEYRFPLYEYLNTGGAIDAVLFVDSGRVGGNLEQLFEGDVNLAAGVGLRGGYYGANVVQLELGFSAEGPQLGLAISKEL